MSEYKFVFDGNPKGLLNNAIDGSAFVFAVVGLASGDKPGLIVLGSVAEVDGNESATCGAFVPHEWRSMDNLPVSFAFGVQYHPSPGGVSFSVEPSLVNMHTKNATEKIQSVSRSPLNVQAETYQELWGGNTSLVTSHGDLVSLAGDLGIDKRDTVLVPIHAEGSVQELDDGFVANFAQAFIGELIKQFIEDKFFDRVEGPLEAAKQYAACLYNDVDAMRYAALKLACGMAGVYAEDETIPLRGEIDGPIEKLYLIALDLGVGPSFLLAAKLDTERLDKFINDLTSTLPNVGKEELYFVYHGLDALIKRERAKLFVDDDGNNKLESRIVNVRKDDTPMFGNFSIN